MIPHEVDTHERQVLGAMLTSTTAIDAAASLTPPMFATVRHGLIFDAITAQELTHGPTDVLGVADCLGPELDRAGGLAYLHELVAGVIAVTSTGWHAGKVRDAAMVRKVRELGAQLQALTDTDSEALDVVDQARATLDRLAVTDDQGSTHADALALAMNSLDRPHGHPTPWERLDDGISGWAPGMLYVVGARPGVGKTVFGIDAILAMAKGGTAAFMASLEMPKVDLYHRMLCNVGLVDAERLQHRRLNYDDRSRLAAAADKIRGYDLIVDDRSGLSLAQLRARVRTVQRTRPVGLVVVDYLSLLTPPRDAPRNDRRVQVDAIAQGLKELAKDLNVPVVALAQLNRAIEARKGTRPNLGDLRESGGIEAAADVVILMHRDVEDDPQKLNITLAKNRHGPQSWFDLTFDGAHSRITALTNWTDYPQGD